MAERKTYTVEEAVMEAMRRDGDDAPFSGPVLYSAHVPSPAHVRGRFRVWATDPERLYRNVFAVATDYWG